MGTFQSNPVAGEDELRSRVVGLLAGYLLASPRFRCPGMDGASVEDMVATEYPAACAAGWVPRQAELAARHPELADALTTFLWGKSNPADTAC